MIYRALLLTILFLGPPVSGFFDILYGSVSIEAFLRCDPSITYWEGELLVYEWDAPFGASELFKTRKFITSNMTKLFLFEPFSPGKDFGLEFEIGYQLKHNCTSSGVYRCISPEPTDVSAFWNSKVNWYIRAFEEGVRMEDCQKLSYVTAKKSLVNLDSDEE